MAQSLVFSAASPNNPSSSSWTNAVLLKAKVMVSRVSFGKFSLRHQSGVAEISRMPATSALPVRKLKESESGQKVFADEMRTAAMKLHTRDQAKEGKEESQSPPVSQWNPSVDGYLQFLVDTKLVFHTLERIIEEEAFPVYSEFRNTGLERSANLAKDLEDFRDRGYCIPDPSTSGVSYSSFLESVSSEDPQSFICHFYNICFAHTAGGRIIGKKVSEKILNGRELEFYKWEGNLTEILKNAKERLNGVAESWSRKEKDRCLEETEKAFQYSADILSLITSA